MDAVEENFVVLLWHHLLELAVGRVKVELLHGLREGGVGYGGETA